MPGLRKLIGDVRGARLRQDPAGRSLCHDRPSAGRRRAGRRRVRDLVPGGRHRHQQGLHRRRAALQRPHPALAGDARHGRRRRSRRSTTIRSSAPTTRTRPPRRSICARSRSNSGLAWNALAAGRSSWRSGAEVCCGVSRPAPTLSDDELHDARDDVHVQTPPWARSTAAHK